MKKHPVREFSGAEDGVSGSMPMNGFATSVPMRRRDNLSVLLGSEMEDTSRPAGLVRRGIECRAQWTMFIGHRIFA